MQQAVDERTKNIEQAQEIAFNGRSIPLKTEKLQAIFSKIQLALDEIKANEAVKAKISLLMQIQNTLDDAAYLIKKEKKEEARRSDASGALYNTLLNYVEFLQRQTTVQRTTLQAKILQQNVNAMNPVGTQNIVRLYEKALKSQRQLSNLEKDAKDPQRVLKNEFLELYFTTVVAHLITLHYFSIKKYTESFAMYQHALGEIQNSLDFSSRNNLSKIP